MSKIMDTKLKTAITDIDFRLLFNSLNYQYFSQGNYNLNIIGIRNLSKGNIQDNTFNDFLCVSYKEYNHKTKYVWEITTDPGLSSLKKPVNSKGCAILVPGQYLSCWQIGLHKGQYEALVQKSPVKVYRDNNKDNILDFNSQTIDSGIFGINIHRSNPKTESVIVDGWSAGCQVFKKVEDFNKFMDLCRKAKSIYSNSFSYTLLTSDQIFNFKN